MAWGKAPIDDGSSYMLMLQHELTTTIGRFAPSVRWRRFLLRRSGLRWQRAGVGAGGMPGRIFNGRIPQGQITGNLPTTNQDPDAKSTSTGKRTNGTCEQKASLEAVAGSDLDDPIAAFVVAALFIDRTFDSPGIEGTHFIPAGAGWLFGKQVHVP